MTDAIIRNFVSEQRQLLELELQSEQEQGITGQQGDERASHILGNLEALDVSVGLYGRTVVELTVWIEQQQQQQQSNSSVLLPAHRFTVGDEVEIRSGSKQNQKDAPGGVISAVLDASISVALFPKKSRGKPAAQTGNTEEDDDDETGTGSPPLRLVPKSSVDVHRKMTIALDLLERHGVDHPIAGSVVDAMFRADLTRDPSIINSLPPLQAFNSNLDSSQLAAISFALQDDRPVALIHGPPGTGKTTTTAELIQQAVSRGMKVLVTAPSNVAVDNILERLVVSSSQPKGRSRSSKRKGTSSLRVVRLGHPARIKASILPYSLEALVQNSDGTEIVQQVRKELQSFLKILSNPNSRSNDKRAAYREVKSLRKEVRTREEKVVKELVSTAQVVLATCVGAANRILDRVEGGFDLVIIDEAAQALEASCWIPILRGKKAVLAGDHKQLSPTIKSRNRNAQSGLSKTMFFRLMELYGDNDRKQTPRISRMLKIQYRMHKDIANWASQAMYGGELLTHESVRDQTLSQLPGVLKSDSNDDDVSETTLLLIDTAGCDMHETVNVAGSRFNQGEAQIVALHVTRLVTMGVQQNQIAIITPYNGQVELLRSLLLPDFPKLEIRSVDGFQGGEREAVVLSLVRSSERGGKDGIGFLKDDRRQNVAVTRAKRHLAVVCDTDTVSQSPFIKNLISWMEQNGEQRSAVEFLALQELENDLRDAEAELLKMVEDSLAPRVKETSYPKPPSNTKDSSQMIETPQARDDSSTLDESRRRALMDKISDFAENGSRGEEISLSSELNSYDRRLVHEFCEQINVGHRSEGEGLDRRVVLTVQKVPLPPDAAPALKVDDIDPTVTKASAFTALLELDDDSDSNDEGGPQESSPRTEAAARSNDSIPAANQMLADLARERAEREKLKQGEANSKPAPTNKPKKKEQQKLGGAKLKQPPPAKVDEKLDDLDDMAFLDTQIQRSQNSHGRKVSGSGKGYRTIVNGMLNSKAAPREAPKNTTASSALQSKLKKAQDDRKSKSKKKSK
jgi:ATP-dependent RNA/DNA helicase IGHMBP2